MEGVLGGHRLDVDVVVGLVVRRGHVRASRRARLAAEGRAGLPFHNVERELRAGGGAAVEAERGGRLMPRRQPMIARAGALNITL